MSRELVAHGRCLLVWAGASLLAVLLSAAVVPALRRAVAAPPSPDRFDAWLVVGCEGAALGAGGWLWVLVTLAALEAAGRAPRRGVPRGLRRVVLAACGAGLVGGLVAPACATPPPPPLAGLPLPDRATSRSAVDDRDPAPAARVRSAEAGPADTVRADTVRVVPGDTLWGLAAADLPDDAPVGAVDERWRAIHAANRDVIGADPDLILPGQQLRLPPGPPPAT